MLREVKSTQRLVRELCFKVTGTGTAAINQGSPDATLVDNGTGDYTLTFAKAGKRLLYAGVQPVADAGDLAATLHTDTDNTRVRVKLWDMTDGTTAKDGVFYLKVSLSDTSDET